MKKNKNLKKIYNRIFKKGEIWHFSKNLEQKTALPSDEREVLKEISWKGKRILDVGCGTGLFAYEAAKHGAKVLGIDYSKEGIAIAKKMHQHPNLEYRCENIFTSKVLRKKFDVIVSLGTLEHMDKPFVVVKKFKSLLKPSGSIILTCPNWVNPRGLILMTLEKLFNAPITLADIHYFSPATFEGWAKMLGMKLTWRTFDISRATGTNLIKDFRKRIPNVLRDAKLPRKSKNIEALLSWLKSDALAFPWKGRHIGASGLYHLQKK